VALQKLIPSHRQRQLAAKFWVGQDGILKAGSLGFGSLNTMTGDTTAPPSESEDGKKKKQRKKALALEIEDCVLQQNKRT
jgi:hypothetical protein